MASLIRWMRRTRIGGGEEGIALVVSLGVLTVLTVAVAGVLEYTSSASRTASYAKVDQVAFSLAEAGINNAMAVLSLATNNALNPSLLPPPPPDQTAREDTYEGGYVKWGGVLDQTTAVWTLTSVGYAKNPTATGGYVERRVSAKVPVYPTLTQPLNNQAWNYIYSTRTGNSCDMTIRNSVTFASSLYVQGNLCLDNTAVISAGPLVVLGQVKLLQNANRVGSAPNPINEAHIGGGCKWKSNPLHNPCSSADNVYATILMNDSPAIAPPVVQWDDWYQNAGPGPNFPCYAPLSSGTTPVFENETVNPARNNSVPNVWDLTPAASYTCWTDYGQLSWNATTKTLTVGGTIFIDGSAKISNNAVNAYNGQATLYLSGTFLLSGTSQLCAGVSGGSCDFAAWNPNTEMLAVVANGSGGQVPAGVGIQLANSARFQGALFATNIIELDNSAVSEGPLVGATVNINNSVQTYVFPTITTVPSGMPGNPAVYAQPNPPEDFSG